MVNAVTFSRRMTAGPGGSPDSDHSASMGRKNSKETIHSGHFMVSDFEAEAQDDEGIEVPDPTEVVEQVEEIQGVRRLSQGGVITYAKPTSSKFDGTTVSIDASLTKLFQTMSLAYRQNITSPKWNCFKGLRLRWKDKIRLNNVIWRCWHMQYIQKKKMTVCQFALDVDIHNRPEAIVLEGKYWKRRLRAVTAEYKKWRLYYKNSLSGVEPMPDQQDMLSSENENSGNDFDKSFLGLEEMDWARSFLNNQGIPLEGVDLSEGIDFTDMLFSPFITSPQFFPFPNPREIARGTGNSDLQQPGLVQLQPDLAYDDMMDIHEMLVGKGLPTVPEEEFFPDVEGAAGLSPPSPPSVSTPVPVAPIEYTARLTATSHDYSQDTPTSLALTQSSSLQIFSAQEHFNLPRQRPQPAHQPTHVSSPHQEHSQHLFLSLPQNQTTEGVCIRPELPKPFSRSRSDHDLDAHSASAIRQESNPTSSSFAVPKVLPRRRSHSGSVPYVAPSTVGNTQGLCAGSISTFAAALSPGTILTSLTPSQMPPQNMPPTSSIPRVITGDLQTGSFSPNSDSALLAHLLTSEPYSTPTSSVLQPVTTSSSQNPAHINKIKVSRLAPRPYPETVITSGGNSISRNNSIMSNNSLSSFNGGCCNSNGSNVTSVTSSNMQKPLLLPNVTLSAVTPSSLKSIHSNNMQVPNWSSINIKGSPPYPEPTSPHSNASSPPIKPFRPKSEVERVQYKEHRRVCHINAEQKRRYNIKNNFDMLHSLIPSVSQNPNSKVSKATMLHKGSEYILQMKQERQQLSEQAEQLRNEIETLSCEISTAQSLLPATGAPMSHKRHNKIREKFEAYVRERTLTNWKYYILSLVADPLLDTFNSSVSTASVDDLCRSSMAWLDQHCSLNVLRPIVSNAMRKLSTSTNILTKPESLPEDIFRRVTKQENKYNTGQFSGNSLPR